MRIASVGAGVSGLVCAHLLHRDHELVVFEASEEAGGHANTVHVATDAGAYDLDTGFVVFNDRGAWWASSARSARNRCGYDRQRDL
jgi:predicted NAD/FAD-binding protein